MAMMQAIEDWFEAQKGLRGAVIAATAPKIVTDLFIDKAFKVYLQRKLEGE